MRGITSGSKHGSKCVRDEAQNLPMDEFQQVVGTPELATGRNPGFAVQFSFHGWNLLTRQKKWTTY